MTKCNKCTKNFKAGACKVGCGFCGEWYHIGCGNISEQLFNVMSKNPQIHWYCEDCNAKAPDVLAVVQKCVKGNEDLKKEMESIQKVVNDMKAGKDEDFEDVIKRIVKKEIEKERANVITTERNSTPEAIREIAKKEVQENNDKKGRESNLVVAGIDEEKDATKEIEDLLSYLNVTVEVDGIRRMGKERKEGKHRQVWVKLASKNERNSVLEKANKLRNENRWKNIYINKDMTEAERKEAYDLRVELRRRRQAEEETGGNGKFAIFRGKVIKKASDREPAEEEDGIQNEGE